MEGWSGETSSGAWTKLEIALEEPDLERICVSHEIDLVRVPVPGRAQLLSLEAQRLIRVMMVERGVRSMESVRPELEAITDRQKNLVGKLRG